jgi:2-phosphoglycerate kinase
MDRDGTTRNALWIGGGQWAGKTTVAALLARRYGLTHYHCDYHDSRSHEDRRVAARTRRGQPQTDWAAYWTNLTPQEMADTALDMFADRFPLVLDDLRALVSPCPILVDGWNLRPDLVATATDDLRRMILLVPTDEWRRHQAAALPRAGRVSMDLPDPARAQRNRLERDRILAQDATHRARARGVQIIEVNGTRDAESITDEVARHFASFLTV